MSGIVNDYVPAAAYAPLNRSDFDPYRSDAFIDSTTNQLIGKYAGKKCFVIGTGCSLRNHDLTQLRGQYVASPNMIWKCPGVHRNFWF